MKGREVIKVDFDWTLDDLEKFMEEHWDKEEYCEFVKGRPQPASIEEYICLPATPNCCVIAYPRKGKIIFSIADNVAGLKRVAISAIPTRSPIGGIAKSALTISRAKEMRGPGAEITTMYADYMRRLLGLK